MVVRTMVQCKNGKIIKRRVVATLLAAMVFGAGFTGYTDKVEAATTTTDGVIYHAETKYVTVNNAATDYYNQNKKAPEAKDFGIDDEYLFAGWYEEDKNTPYTANVPDGAIAKFVPAQVLSVKSQVQDKDKTVEETTVFRIVSSVDSLDYKNVGFSIEATDSKGKLRKWSGQSTKVYEKFFADDTNREASEIFGGKSEFFFSYKLKGIPTKDGLEEFKTSFYATPYWTTLDGTKVEGLTKCVHVEDYYNDYISVPVYLQSEDAVEVAAGILSVAYDTNLVKYVDCQNGSLLEEGMANGNAGTVKCVANVADIRDNVKADGMFINLRFKPVDDVNETKGDLTNPATDGLKNKPEGGYVFRVTVDENSFCNVKEEFVTGIEAWDSFYY